MHEASTGSDIKIGLTGLLEEDSELLLGHLDK